MAISADSKVLPVLPPSILAQTGLGLALIGCGARLTPLMLPAGLTLLPLIFGGALLMLVAGAQGWMSRRFFDAGVLVPSGLFFLLLSRSPLGSDATIAALSPLIPWGAFALLLLISIRMLSLEWILFPAMIALLVLLHLLAVAWVGTLIPYAGMTLMVFGLLHAARSASLMMVRRFECRQAA